MSHTVWNVFVDFLPNLSLRDYFEWSNLIYNLYFASKDYKTGLVHSKKSKFCVLVISHTIIQRASVHFSKS